MNEVNSQCRYNTNGCPFILFLTRHTNNRDDLHAIIVLTEPIHALYNGISIKVEKILIAWTSAGLYDCSIQVTGAGQTEITKLSTSILSLIWRFRTWLSNPDNILNSHSDTISKLAIDKINILIKFIEWPLLAPCTFLLLNVFYPLSATQNLQQPTISKLLLFTK